MHRVDVREAIRGNDDFLSAENHGRTDETAAEIFSSMLGIEIVALESTAIPDRSETHDRTAIVGFSGSMRGSCEVRMDSTAARFISAVMLGGEAADQDEGALDDAVGEICNMLAGGWKDRVPALASRCSLSPPTVISGNSYTVHRITPSLKLSRVYRFADHDLHFTLYREDCSGAKAEEIAA